MQIRERRRVIQLIRTEYDPSIKRGREKVISSFQRFGQPTDETRSALTEAENKQLDEWLEAKKTLEDVRSKLISVQFLADRMNTATRAFREDPETFVQYADDIKEAYAELRKAMRYAERRAGNQRDS